jgi:hypothetical protein
MTESSDKDCPSQHNKASDEKNSLLDLDLQQEEELKRKIAQMRKHDPFIYR